jgi:DNA-binding IclR family transcriptional regulator
LFSGDTPTLSVPDIARALQLPISTAYRYISALRQAGLVEETDSGGAYHLGTMIIKLARNVPRKRLQDIALPFMQKLSAKTGEAICLSTLHSYQGVCVERVEAQHTLRVSHDLGAIFPLHAGASGKILLAYLDRKTQETIIRDVGLRSFSPTTITDRKKLYAELAQIRKQGYALSDGEVIPGTFGIGAPVMSCRDKVVAALSISAPTGRIRSEDKRDIISLVVEAARRISEGVQAQEV